MVLRPLCPDILVSKTSGNLHCPKMTPRQDRMSKHDQQYPDTELTRLISLKLSRRSFVGSLGLGMAGFLAGAPFSSSHAHDRNLSSLLDFEPVPASTADRVIVPKGYSANVLISWGDPIFEKGPAFDPGGSTDDVAQAQQFGDNNDGMSLFPLGRDHAILAVNNEYVNNEYLFAHGGKPKSFNDVRKSQAAHGVSIFEIVLRNGSWSVDQNGKRNRRITANTVMEMTGPAAGHPLLQTDTDPTGKLVLGTMNNCANGQTPWGTYLTCEENFNYYFGSAEKFKPTGNEKRYGLKGGQSRFGWEAHDRRFDLNENRNEANRFGWVVEIDPMNPESTPLKRSALGRFKHENASLTINHDGHVVIYLGDDERGEHLYRFISRGKYNPYNRQANRELLSEGTLYVAKFHGGHTDLRGQGEWLELTHGKNGLTAENGFADQAEVLIYTRRAATVAGGTTMDRPEWVAIHPNGRNIYCTLTNNKHRGVQRGQGLNGPNPRAENHYGQIIRWRPSYNDHISDRFYWDIFLLAGNPLVHKDARRGTPNIHNDNMFNSPDGIGFDAAGRMWIQTDGKYSNKGDFAGMGNNQMLCADPSSGEIRRFMTGPVACEITGLCFSPDHKTMFVGIQHPGEDNKASHFPGGGNSKPRSSIIMITRDNGKSFAV